MEKLRDSRKWTEVDYDTGFCTRSKRWWSWFMYEGHGAASRTFVPSLIAVHGAPSSCSSLISFSATRLSVSLLLPLKTVAYVPCRK